MVKKTTKTKTIKAKKMARARAADVLAAITLYDHAMAGEDVRTAVDHAQHVRATAARMDAFLDDVAALFDTLAAPSGLSHKDIK